MDPVKRKRAHAQARSATVGLLLIALFVTFGALAVRPPRHLLDAGAASDAGFTIGAAGAVALLGLVFVTMARQERRGYLLAVGLGFVAVGVAGIGVGEVLPAVVGSDHLQRVFRSLGALGRAAGLAAFWLAFAIERPRLSWVWPLHTAVIALIVLSVAVPGPAEAVWLILFVAFWSRSRHGGPRVSAWIAVALLGLTLGEVARGAPLGVEAAWGVAAAAERLLAVLIAVLGVLEEIQRARLAREEALARAERRARHFEDLAEMSRRSGEERSHDIRSALTGIEYAALAMRRYGADLDASSLEQLEMALRSELTLLKRLVALPEPRESSGTYDVGAVVAGIASIGWVRNMDVEVECEGELVARGDPAALQEVLHNLLENADVHAPGSPVWLRGSRLEDWVLLEVDDAGPGIPEEHRESVFRRGRDAEHPTSAAGSGLGLFIARRLASEQGGHVWASSSVRGGASLRVAVPAAVPVGAPDPGRSQRRREAAQLVGHPAGRAESSERAGGDERAP